MAEKQKKRPIDRIRDSAIFGRIGVDGDDSAVQEGIPLGEKLCIVKTNAIYTFQLADQIDPQRVNASVPNAQQRVLERGSDDLIVAKILLTGKTLFENVLFRDEDKRIEARKIAFELTCDVAALEDMTSDLERAEKEATGFLERNKPQRDAQPLPSAGNVKARFDAFTQKVGHVIGSLEKIAKLFYLDELKAKWISNLIELTKQKYGSDDGFHKFISHVGPVLLRYLEFRNAVEHERADNYARVSDFHFLPTGQISFPAVSMMLNGDGPHRAHLSTLMRGIVDDLPLIIESFLAYICNANVEPAGGLPVFVHEFPEDQRRYKHQKYYYAVLFGNQPSRLG